MWNILRWCWPSYFHKNNQDFNREALTPLLSDVYNPSISTSRLWLLSENCSTINETLTAHVVQHEISDVSRSLHLTRDSQAHARGSPERKWFYRSPPSRERWDTPASSVRRLLPVPNRPGYQVNVSEPQLPCWRVLKQVAAVREQEVSSLPRGCHQGRGTVVKKKKKNTCSISNYR